MNKQDVAAWQNKVFIYFCGRLSTVYKSTLQTGAAYSMHVQVDSSLDGGGGKSYAYVIRRMCCIQSINIRTYDFLHFSLLFPLLVSRSIETTTKAASFYKEELVHE